jgi:hypothetical protein
MVEKSGISEASQAYFSKILGVKMAHVIVFGITAGCHSEYLDSKELGFYSRASPPEFNLPGYISSA